MNLLEDRAVPAVGGIRGKLAATLVAQNRAERVQAAQGPFFPLHNGRALRPLTAENVRGATRTEIGRTINLQINAAFRAYSANYLAATDAFLVDGDGAFFYDTITNATLALGAVVDNLLSTSPRAGGLRVFLGTVLNDPANPNSLSSQLLYDTLIGEPFDGIVTNYAFNTPDPIADFDFFIADSAAVINAAQAAVSEALLAFTNNPRAFFRLGPLFPLLPII